MELQQLPVFFPFYSTGKSLLEVSVETLAGASCCHTETQANQLNGALTGAPMFCWAVERVQQKHPTGV